VRRGLLPPRPRQGPVTVGRGTGRKELLYPSRLRGRPPPRPEEDLCPRGLGEGSPEPLGRLEPAPAAPGILATLDSALGAAALPVSSLRPDRAAEYLAAASLSQLLALLLEAGSRIGEATQTRGGAVPDSPAGRGGEEGRPWTIEELRAWIDTHYEESFTLEEMVGRCALNTSDFSRRFKDATGSPLFEYLNRRRVSRAALLLRDGELPITEIAFSVGYNNLSFFNRYFLRLMGMTPGEYRRRNR